MKIQGHYPLANLLQELYYAKVKGAETIALDVSQLTEDPVHRIRRLIQTQWWDNLTRHLDADGIAAAAPDTKVSSSRPRIYIPVGAPEQYEYYSKLAEQQSDLQLDVRYLPKGDVDPEFVKSINKEPGILALEMDVSRDGDSTSYTALPFIVPGDRFNELYNWDSVLLAWGLLESHPHLVKSIIRNFIFEIQHYGKVLNANRSYYLGRSQPPLLTDLALRTYQKTQSDPGSKELLATAIQACMKEYHSWWMTPPRYDEESGLNRYRPVGAGLPPECEATQFDHVLAPYAEKYKMTYAQVMEAYNDGKIHEPDLDVFCLHDRAVRESGHDVSNRVEGVCADLATVDLNCLLYKYETDIAHIISEIFSDQLPISAPFATPGRPAGTIETSDRWHEAASRRRRLLDQHLWNESKGMYVDYNTSTHKQTDYESATTFWALWSGAASPHQADLLVQHALPKLENVGGLAVSTERSRGPVSAARPQKQWDFPFGWPPHQLLAWEGLQRYGFEEEKERLVYKWLHMMTRVFVDFNGTVVEKYDVTQLERPHRVDAEYGNQGSHFRYAPQEGYVFSFLLLFLFSFFFVFFMGCRKGMSLYLFL